MGRMTDAAGLLERAWNKLPRWSRHCLLRAWHWTKSRDELIDENLDLRRRLKVVQAELEGLSKLKEIAQDTSKEYERQIRAVREGSKQETGQLVRQFEARSVAMAKRSQKDAALVKQAFALLEEYALFILGLLDRARELAGVMFQYQVPVAHDNEPEPGTERFVRVWDIVDSARTFFERYGPALERMREVALIPEVVDQLRHRTGGPGSELPSAQPTAQRDEEVKGREGGHNRTQQS